MNPIPPANLFHLHRQVWLLLLCVLAVLWGAVAWQYRQSETQTLEQLRLQTSGLSLAFAEQTHATFREIDHMLVDLRDALPRGKAEFAAQARQYLSSLGERSLQVGLIDANGRLTFSSLEPNPKSVDLSDREHFQVHRAGGPDQLFISTPILGRVSGKWSIQLTRAIFEHGHFAGVVVISVDPAYFVRFFQKVDLGQQGLLMLVRDSGDIMARSLAMEATMGRVINTSPFGDPGAPIRGSIRRRSVLDGVERLFSYCRLPDYGVTVISAVAVAQALGPVNAQNWVLLLIATAASVLMTLLTGLLLRGSAQRKQAQLALLDSNYLLRTIIDTAPVRIFWKDKDLRYLGCNPAFAQDAGTASPEEVVGKNDYQLSWKEQAELYRADDRQVMASGVSKLSYDEPQTTPDGRPLWLRTSKVPLRTSSHETLGVLGIYLDTTEQRQTTLALQESEKSLRESQILAGLGSYVLDIASGQWKSSQALDQVLGIDASYERSVAGWEALIYPEDRANMGDYFRVEVLAQHKAFDQEYRIIRHSDQALRWVHGLGQLALDAQGLAQEMHGTIQDITERQLEQAELRIAAIAFEAQEGMVVTDANSVILRVNAAFTRITGYTAQEIVGKTPRVLSSGRQDASFYAELWRSLTLSGSWKGEIWNRRKCGEVYPEELSITAVMDPGGLVSHYVATFSDISVSKAAENEIRNLAFYDPLTQLPNRRLLLDRLRLALGASARSGKQGGLLFLDLDHFKTLNDTLGHGVGDLLLQQVAHRLLACVREGDTVARLGGDEFVVMLEDLSEQSMEAAAQTKVVAEKILAALGLPYHLDEHEYHGTPSIGANTFDGHRQAVEALLKQADLALYQAKNAGRNTLRFFDPQMQEAVNTRAELEHELRLALEQQQFRLYYQVQVDGANRAMGVEALIRWLHPLRGLVSPIRFIPVAEDSGLIVPIGLWVLHTACAQIQAWQKEALTRELVVAVNVSAKQFRQPDFVTQVQLALQAHAIAPRLLKLELTESMLLDNVEDTVATMNALNALGVRFSLDDFGTGYSSLQYLKRLPIDQLKIDQSFVRDLTVASNDEVIVRTIIAMAKSLNLGTIAEGVETAQQRQILLDNGCAQYQGYLFAQPLPIEQLEALLRQLPK